MIPYVTEPVVRCCGTECCRAARHTDVVSIAEFARLVGSRALGHLGFACISDHRVWTDIPHSPSDIGYVANSQAHRRPPASPCQPGGRLGSRLDAGRPAAVSTLPGCCRDVTWVLTSLSGSPQRRTMPRCRGGHKGSIHREQIADTTERDHSGPPERDVGSQQTAGRELTRVIQR